MKRFVPVLLLLLAGTAFAADDMDKYVEMMRSDLRTEKTTFLTETLALSDADGAKFWPIQREYETELAKIGDQRIQLLKDYAADGDSLKPEAAKQLVDRAFKIEQSRLTLLKKYVDKVSKSVSPIVGMRFAQTEAIVNAVIDLQVRAHVLVWH